MQQQNINRSFRYFQHSKLQPDNQGETAIQNVFGGSAELTYAGVGKKKGYSLLLGYHTLNPGNRPPGR